MEISPILPASPPAASHSGNRDSSSSSSSSSSSKHLFRYIGAMSIVLLATFQFILFVQASAKQDIPPPLGDVRRLQQTPTPVIKTNCSASGLIPSTIPPPEQTRKSFFRKTTAPKKKPCALLFFGLAKQFKAITLPSIKEHILNTPEHAECDIYAHNYDIKSVDQGTHPEENHVSFNPNEIYNLTSNVVMDTVEDFKAARDLKFFMSKKFVPTRHVGWNADSLRNMYKQWHSIERVWDLMEETEKKMGIEYERVGMFRSDVKYVTPINIFDGDAVIPKFGFVTNDRMFYGLRENTRIWSKIRFPGVSCYKPYHAALNLHSEFYMKDFVLVNIPAEVETRDICFHRVRGNGKVLKDDCRKKYGLPTFLLEAGLSANYTVHANSDEMILTLP